MVSKKRMLKLTNILMAVILILFFSGKFTEIPYGTQEGGIISVVGAGIIGGIGISTGLLIKKYYPE